MYKINIYIFILALFVLEVLASCANIKAPTGGPKDTTPPTISEFYPTNKTINFNENFITIEFDKYMNKSKVVENISISPELELSYSWSGKELEIEFQKELEKNTTYSLVLGTEYSDYLGNKPTESFSLIFSTGSELDSGRIEGKLFEEKPDGIYIFAYKLGSIRSDTLNIFQTPPDYKVQCGSSGEFNFNALKKGHYRLFAIDDKLKNNVLDEKLDRFGSPMSDVFVSENYTPFLPIKINNPIDITGPNIINVRSIQNKNLEITFDEAIDINSIKPNYFLIEDSLGTNKNKINELYYLSLKDSNKVELYLDSDLDTNITSKLTVLYTNILDTLGNKMNDTTLKNFFFNHRYTKPKPSKLLTTFPKDSIKNYPIENLILEFDQFLNKTISDSTFKLSADSTEIFLDYNMITPKSIEVKLLPHLSNDKWYKLSISLNNIKDIRKNIILDSLHTFSFKTVAQAEFNTISGSFTDSLSACDNYTMTLLSEKKLRSIKLNNDYKWQFDSLEAGKYSYFIYCDKNNNDRYDYGTPFPFSFSEPFSIKPPQDIIIKERWDIEDIIIKY